MKKFFTLKAILVGIPLVLSGWHLPAQEQPRPNIIFILADDLGWSSLSCSMNPADARAVSDYHETPNLERLARAGMRFSRAYASASICSPSRRSILFGQTPIREGDEEFKDQYDPRHSTHRTIPQVLKGIDPRYRAAHYGKWDMRADFFPEDAGYDESDGNTGNRTGDVMTDKDDKWTSRFFVDDPKHAFALTARAMNFMERETRAGSPFYLQVSHYATHVDIQSRKETYDKYASKKKGTKHSDPGFAAMLDDLDAAIGQLLDKVQALGIADHTYIFFMADNGATEFLPPVKNRLDHPSVFDKPMRNYPLRGGKWTLYEGGIRVPLLVAGPGIQANSHCDVPVAGWDLLPTFSDLAGQTSAGGVTDGGSFANILHNAGKGAVQRTIPGLFFHRYNKSYPHSAYISGTYKVIHFWKSGKNELYDLAKDPGELKDLASSDPSRTKKMSDALIRYMDDVHPGLTSQYK
jgi:arylsulfatase A-like enzyme